MAVAVWQRMQERRAALIEEGDAILEAATEAGDFSDEQRARLTAIQTERAQLTADIDLAYAAERRDAGLPAGAPPAPAPSDGLPTPPARTENPWRSMGEFFQAVATAGEPGNTVDPRLHVAAAASGMSAGVSSDGGWLIHPEYTDRLLASAREASQLMASCDSIPVGAGADGIEAPFIDETSRADGSRWGAVQVYRAAEASAVTAASVKLGLMKMSLEEMRGLAYTTERLLRNAPALEKLLGDAFASEFAFKIDDEIIRGTGAGECLGILNAPATVSVAKEGGQSAATIEAVNLSKMWARLRARNRGKSVWLYNQAIEPQLDQLSIIVGATALEPRIVTYGPDGVLRIKGRPVLAIEQAAALGTVGDIILADLSDYALITQGALEAETSMHVRFVNHERTFRWTYMINGQPKTRSALTPFKGADTLSPYVTLATRA